MLLVLTKLGRPEQVGQFALGLAVCTPIWMFANLHLREVQATDARREWQFRHYLGLRLAASVAAMAIIAVMTYAIGFRGQVALTVVLVGLMRGLESLGDIFYGLLQQHDRMDRISKTLLMKGPLAVVGLLAGFYWTHSVPWAVGCAAVGLLAVLVAYDVRGPALVLGANSDTSRQTKIDWFKGLSFSRPRWDTQKLLQISRLALPLGIVTTLISLNVNIPRYFVEHYCGSKELGVFAAMSYLMLAGATVVTALGQSASARLAKYYACGDRAAFGSLLLKLGAIGSLLGISGVLAVAMYGPRILRVFYGTQYVANNDVFVWLMVAAGIGYVCTFLAYGMTATRYFKVQFPLFLSVTVITVVGSSWLVPRMGMLGAAIALVVAMVAQLAGSLAIMFVALVRQEIPVKVKGKYAIV
jgi:O-antigen/teichoic acid export membrane protein